MHTEEHQSGSKFLCTAFAIRCAKAGNKRKWLHPYVSSLFFCMTFGKATSLANSKNLTCDRLGIHKGLLKGLYLPLI